jgi:3-deoxy-7-phosphoheptulonate synthase
VILRLRGDTTETELVRLTGELTQAGLRVMRSNERRRPILAVAGDLTGELRERVLGLAFLEEAVEKRGEWLRADLAFRDRPSIVDVSGIRIGGGKVAVIAGPCGVEGRDVIHESARIVRDAGAHILRGGAFKPRTSPYAFQGLGREGLRLLKEAGDSQGLPVVSEVMDAAQVPTFRDLDIDCLQIGARNMQNFTLLRAAAGAGRPVLLKRGLAATVAEWLSAAEYLLAHGCDDVVLCERGIRTFETATRNTLDLSVLPLLELWTHLPVVVDPSHATGIPALIPPLSRAAIAAGAAGIAVEVHPRPEDARSDGAQALLPGELAELVATSRAIAGAVGARFTATRALDKSHR